MTRGALLLALGLIVLARPALALKIAPFKAGLSLDGSSPGQVFRVENNSAEPAAVQVSIWTWEVAPDGTETNRSAEDDFTVFPAQLVLEPHESRAVRVQWAGADRPAAEKPYRLLAEQLPVQLKDTPGRGSAVRFMLRFKAALYVAPGPVQSDVAVTAIAQTADTLSLTLANRGTGHTLLRHAVLHLTLADGRAVDLAGPALKPLDDENIHAGRTRTFALALPPGLAGKVAGAKLDFDPAF